MPIYEYLCDGCNHCFDELQKVSDAHVSVCPKCSEERVRRVVSSSSFHLKGEGWYKDHYGLKTANKEAGKASGKGSDSSGGGE